MRWASAMMCWTSVVLPDASHAEGNVQGDGAGRDGLHGHALLGLAQLHDGALAELLLDLQNGVLDRLALVCLSHAVSLLGWGPPAARDRSRVGQQF
jgi:hypothetical protein